MTLYYAHQYVTTQLSVAGGISDTDTLNITLQDVTGIDTTKPGIALLDYQDPLDLTKAEWITYTTINVSKVFQGVTRGAEGSIARTHSDGCSIAFPISKSHINNLNDAMVLEHDVTGHHSGTLRSKIISTTRVLTAATGDVAYTGVGFIPTSIIAFASINSLGISSFGMTDSSLGKGYLYQPGSATAGTFETGVTNFLVIMETFPSAYQSATIKSYDADGFTLTWTKTGSPINTAALVFLCFR